MVFGGFCVPVNYSNIGSLTDVVRHLVRDFSTERIMTFQDIIVVQMLSDKFLTLDVCEKPEQKNAKRNQIS